MRVVTYRDTQLFGDFELMSQGAPATGRDYQPAQNLKRPSCEACRQYLRWKGFLAAKPLDGVVCGYKAREIRLVMYS